MKLLFASDSFKGSLSSEKTVALLAQAAETVFGACETSGVPVADGGEGTVDAVIQAENGRKITFATVSQDSLYYIGTIHLEKYQDS